MKELFRRILPRPVKHGPHQTPAAPATLWTYSEDGMATTHVADFLADARFQRAYAAGKATGSWGSGELRWRVYTVLWAAELAWRLPGDFVECGVHKGGQAIAILNYLSWKDTNRKFHLLDTFHGFPPELRAVAAAVHRGDYQEDCWAEVQARFAAYCQVNLIRGPVPRTLSLVPATRIAFLSLDMNCAEPEVAALEFFWPRLSPGAPVILDDYAFAEPYRRQKEAIDGWAKQQAVTVLTLPTGQGLILKT